MRDLWEPYWQSRGKASLLTTFRGLLSEGQQEELAGCFFPPPPTEEEIAREAPEYIEQVSKMLVEFAKITDKDN